MNYHIIPQDKFFHSYIEDIYKLQQEDSNVFWVRGNEGDSVFFHTTRPVVYIGNDCDSIVRKLRLLQSNDKLIVSWYDLFIGDCILKANINNRLYTYLMGGDFYDDPQGYHDFWLYDSFTRKIIKKIRHPRIHLHLRPQNWFKYSEELKTIINYRTSVQKAYRRKLETIARINILITGANNDAEISLLKKIYPSFKGKYICGSYDQNYDLAKDLIIKTPYNGEQPLKILLGNSADPTNNHIDACKIIDKKITDDYNIYCPLSYGDNYYSIYFQKWAKQHLQTKIHLFLDFMNRNDYIKLLNEMDIVVMYHNRQQAMGNIITSLTLGKPIFLKSQNPVFQMLKKIGVPYVYNISDLGNVNIFDVCLDAQNKREYCISIIKKYYSEDARLNYLKKIL